MSEQLETPLLCQRAQLTYKPNMGPRRTPRALSRPYIQSDITHSNSLLNHSRTPTINIRILSYHHRTLFGATRGPDTKNPTELATPALLTTGYRDPRAIHGSSYAARSSPRSKHCNAPISMQAIMDSDENLCMMIPTIKRRDLSGYKEIITCESCSYVNPKYLHP